MALLGSRMSMHPSTSEGSSWSIVTCSKRVWHGIRGWVKEDEGGWGGGMEACTCMHARSVKCKSDLGWWTHQALAQRRSAFQLLCALLQGLHLLAHVLLLQRLDKPRVVVLAHVLHWAVGGACFAWGGWCMACGCMGSWVHGRPLPGAAPKRGMEEACWCVQLPSMPAVFDTRSPRSRLPRASVRPVPAL